MQKRLENSKNSCYYIAQTKMTTLLSNIEFLC